MKISKFIAAALAATMLTTAACGLIGCDKDAAELAGIVNGIIDGDKQPDGDNQQGGGDNQQGGGDSQQGGGDNQQGGGDNQQGGGDNQQGGGDNQQGGGSGGDDVGGGGSGSDVVETGYDLYVNGNIVANLQFGTGGAAVAPDNLIWDLYASNVSLEAGDTVTFTAGDSIIVSMWASENTAIVGAGSEVQGNSVTVSVSGTYTVSFTQWEDNVADQRCVAYIGPLSGGGGDDVGGGGGGQLTGDCTLNSSLSDWGTHAVLEEVTPTDGAKKQYSVTVTFDSEVEFKVVYNGEWISNVHGGSSASFTGGYGSNITLAAGTYTIILQVWNDAGDDVSILINNA